MYYKTEVPRVVGEFDAENLHARIDEVIAEHNTDRPWEIQTKLAEEMGLPYASMSNIAQIHWKGLFRPVGFGSLTTDGDVNDLRLIGDARGLVDEWHPDTTSARILTLPEILTTASRYPTVFLVGKIALPKGVFRDYQFFTMDFWGSEEGKSSIDAALERGNVQTIQFEPGEVLKVPSGTLHKRELPDDASGYRYFMRLFPKFYLTHSGSVLGRMRPLSH